MNAQHKPISKILEFATDRSLLTGRQIPMARRLQRSHQPISFWLQWVCLIGIFVGSLHIAIGVVNVFAPAAAFVPGPLAVHKIQVLVAICLVLVIYPKFGIFRRLRQPKWALLVMSCSWLSVVVATFGALYLAGLLRRPDAVILTWTLIVLLLQPLVLVGGQAIARVIRNRCGVEIHSLVVGNGVLARGLVARLQRNPFLPDAIVGLVAHGGNLSQGEIAADGPPLLGDLGNLCQLVEQHSIDRIYVALPMGQSARLTEVQSLVQDLNVDIVWVPDILSLTLLNPGLMEISGYPLLSLSESPMSYFGNAFAKSLLDVVVATLMLIVLSPVMLLSTIAIKLTSPGPVLYWQYRHGWDGSVFRIYKFRSMVVHEENEGFVSQATKDDARVTRVGRLLRRTSIDELPQLMNVLNGTMSLVGPRPHAIAHNEDYAHEIKSYMSRHRIKPGLTGLAQINGARGETDTLDKMRQRVNYDLAYINDWSLWRDFLILLRTPIALLRNKAVY